MLINVVKGLHILAVIAWMAGLLYLPRLFVYHFRAEAGSKMEETFQTMERRLLFGIMTPAMLAVLVLGASLVWLEGWRLLLQPWLMVKLIGVAALLACHVCLASAQRDFARGGRPGSERFWRLINEAPFVAAFVIVLAVTTKLAI
jgi:putative membrane protein